MKLSRNSYPLLLPEPPQPRSRPSRLLLVCLSVVSLFGLAACQGLTAADEIRYVNLLSQGATPVKKKEPLVAAALNLGPGLGDIYTGQWGAFALDFLFWMPSSVWAVPQGYMTAKNINKHATLAHYTVGGGAHFGYDPTQQMSKLPPRAYGLAQR